MYVTEVISDDSKQYTGAALGHFELGTIENGAFPSIVDGIDRLVLQASQGGTITAKPLDVAVFRNSGEFYALFSLTDEGYNRVRGAKDVYGKPTELSDTSTKDTLGQKTLFGKKVA